MKTRILTLIRVVLFLIGLIVASLGAAIIVQTNWGSDPVSAAIQGIVVICNYSISVSTIIFNIPFLIVVLIIGRRYINVGTLIHPFFFGFVWELFDKYLKTFNLSRNSEVVRLLLVVVGAILLGVGLGMYQAAKLGTGPSDAFNMSFSQLIRIPLSVQRTAFDASLTLFAFVCGVRIYFGTIVCVFLVGLVMSASHRFIEKKVKLETTLVQERGLL